MYCLREKDEVTWENIRYDIGVLRAGTGHKQGKTAGDPRISRSLCLKPNLRTAVSCRFSDRAIAIISHE